MTAHGPAADPFPDTLYDGPPHGIRAGGPIPDAAATKRLAELVRELAVVHGRVTLSSGREADYYVDLRRATLHHEAGPLIGVLMRQLTADWDFAAVGGLTLGADPVATAMMHTLPVVPWTRSSCARRPRSMGCNGASRARTLWAAASSSSRTPRRRVRPRSAAVQALREADAEVVGVATIVDRATGADGVLADLGLEYRSLLGLADLGLTAQ